MKSYVIGIAGGSASGKTSIVHEIKEKFNDQVVVLYFDDYYKDLSALSYEERSKINFDHPSAFDLDMMARDLEDLKNGQTIVKPIYDFTIHNRSDKKETLKSAPIILVDGLFTLAIEEIAKLCDLKIFVDTPADIRFIRRLERDLVERGRSLESVKNQYLQTVRPMHELFVEPSKYKANLIVLDGVENVEAMDVIVSKYILNFNNILTNDLNYAILNVAR